MLRSELGLTERQADGLYEPMTFAIPGAAYDRFMGRYSSRLAPQFADFATIRAGMRVLDVGCGPGALTTELVRRVGAAHVAAIDPSSSFVEACRSRLQDADIRQGASERLPWADGVFDAALAQLVLSFVSDAGQSARELRRVVRPGGTIAACMWHEGASFELGHVFWKAVAAIDPAAVEVDARMRYRKQGEIAQLWASAGLQDVEETFLDVSASYRDFDEFWQSIVHGAGPIGGYVASVSQEREVAIREGCEKLLGRPGQAFELRARACAARARVP